MFAYRTNVKLVYVHEIDFFMLLFRPKKNRYELERRAGEVERRRQAQEDKERLKELKEQQRRELELSHDDRTYSVLNLIRSKKIVLRFFRLN